MTPTPAAFVQASHNMLFTMNDAKWRRDLAKTKKAQVVCYQEAEGRAQRATLAAWSRENGRGLYHPAATGNPIGWDKAEFPSVVQLGGKPFQAVVESHAGAAAFGVDARFTPPREFSLVGLNHKSGRRFLFLSVHAVQGATKLESNPDNPDSDELNAYKDWAAGQYWLDVVGLVAREMSRNASDREMKPFWHGIAIGGDYNAYLDRSDRWYYPGSLLPALFRPDSMPKGLDHIQATHGSDLVAGRRWTEKGLTDHPLHYQRWAIRPVADFPRQ